MFPPESVVLGVTAYGDLDGDGLEEAAVIVHWRFNAGVGYGNDGYIYALKDGKLKLISKYASGDKYEGMITGATIRDAQLLSTKCIFDMDGNNYIETTRYKMNGGSLSQISRTSKKTEEPYKGRGAGNGLQRPQTYNLCGRKGFVYCDTNASIESW